VLQVRSQDVLPDTIGRDVVRVLTMRAEAFAAGAIVTIDKVDLHLDVPGDLTHERRRDISTLVKWNSRAAPVGMTELLVRASLNPSFVSTPIT
jgi:hypothetical protein